MQKYEGQLLNKYPTTQDGIAAVGVYVTVRKASDNSLATIYTDSTGTTAKDNPFPTDTRGRYGFYCVPDRYKFTFSNGEPDLILDVVENPISGLDGVKALQSDNLSPQTTIGFHAGQYVGGATYIYNPYLNKSLHNGGTIIAPEALDAWDGVYANLSTLLNWTGTGSGCFVKLVAEYTIEEFGGLPKPNLCTESLQKLLDTYGKFVGVPGKEYLIRRVWFNRAVDLDLNGCTIWGDVYTTSGFRADLIDGIKIRNGTMKHVKTVGVYVQALTTNNCQNIVLEDLLLDGFSQFTLQFSHSIDGEYSGFTLRRVKIHNAGNFFADPSSVANCCEFLTATPARFARTLSLKTVNSL